ncbi:NAD(P)H-binding protein, partial [Paenibacillus polymyxa]|nr:NAD(P)H-binding protein [Paenibacillus polymyxa]
GLTYTVLRPVWLTDKPTEGFQLTGKGEAYKGTETSRASIGRFVADLVKAQQLYANQNLGISEPDTDGDRPAAYRWPMFINANSVGLSVRSLTM